MAAQRLFEPPQRPRPTIAERSPGLRAVIDPRGHLLRGTAFALGLAVVGFWAPLAFVLSLLF